MLLKSPSWRHFVLQTGIESQGGVGGRVTLATSGAWEAWVSRFYRRITSRLNVVKSKYTRIYALLLTSDTFSGQKYLQNRKCHTMIKKRATRAKL